MSASEYGVLARLLQMCDRCVWNGTCLNIFRLTEYCAQNLLKKLLTNSSAFASKTLNY